MPGLMRTTLIVVSGLALAAGFAWWVFMDETRQPKDDHLDVQRRVFWTLIARNTGNRALRNVEISSFVPVQQRWHQRLDRIDPSLPHDVLAHDQRPFLRLTLATIPPFGQREIRIDAILTLASNSADSDGSQAARLLDPEPLIESKHPEITAVARSLKRSGALESARAIHGWLEETMDRSGYDAIDRGALHALRSATGDCTEYAALTVALARAMDLPARLVGGYVSSESGPLAFHDYHAWAELEVVGRWLIMDTHRGRFDASPSEYIATHVGLKPVDGAAWTRFHSDEADLDVAMK